MYCDLTLERDEIEPNVLLSQDDYYFRWSTMVNFHESHTLDKINDSVCIDVICHRRLNGSYPC